MNKIFYKKGSEKNYKFYLIIDWILIAITLIFIALLIFMYNKVVLVGLIISFILWLLWHFVIEIMLLKNLSFNAFIINKEKKELYKIGMYPNYVGALPSVEEFMQDEHFLYDLYYGNFKFSKLFKYYASTMKYTDAAGNSILKALARLHNQKYVLKQLSQNDTDEIIYKVTKIHSVEFIKEKNCYCIICDISKLNNNNEIEKTKMYINKDFDLNNEIKDYIDSVCINKKI